MDRISKEEIKHLGRGQLSDDEHLLATKMIEKADKELDSVRIQFRWGTKQIALLKEISKKMGIPYQTYIKQVLYNKVIEDLNKSSKFI